MKKILLGTSILFFAIHSYADNKPNESIEKSFSWVVADRSDLQRTAYERLRKETHYPKELDVDDYQLSEKRRVIQHKISTLEKQENEKCDVQFLIKSKTETPTTQANASEDPREHYTTKRFNKELQECYANISGMKEHQALTAQQNEINSINQKRRGFDESLRKKADEILDFTVSAYSKENNIMLVVNSRSDAIIYNKDLVVLDVTQKLKSIINTKKSLAD